MKVLLLCQDLGIELDWEGNVIDEIATMKEALL